MINNIKDLKEYILADKKALGIKHRFPTFWGDHIWKMEIHLRLAEYFHNIKGSNLFLKALSKYCSYRFKVRCEKRCCEILLNVIGPGLCIWHGFNIIINSHAVIGNNFGISANCNVGHAHNLVPVIGDNVTMSFGSKVLGGITVCNNVTIGASALVIKSITTEYCTVAGIPAKIISIKDPSKPLIRG